ncbi:transportin-3 isoform X1 [Carex littledalei]|uniref:Transportin-3 isoform X1 n=1 Tax=Carex littledalei TaxID=544730 RepID=A0A833RJ91_9POAL|nr:transportin-3 isoform X1 [Carex littledalei]
MDLQKMVINALAALYHGTNDALRAEADRWLQDFQHTLDAWQVADSLLHDPNSSIETLIFCSQTLRSKVQRDFEELPGEAFGPLRDSLSTLLKKLNKGPPKVRTQICIAIAALAVHVSVEDWGGGGVVNWLSVEMKSQPELLPSFLELLTVLPQEANSHRIAARPERRRQFEKELVSFSEVALSLLTACWDFEELKEQVLDGFASWLRFCHGISAATLAGHPLVGGALSSLNSDQLLEAAVNVTSELIHYTVSKNSTDISSQLPLIHVLVPCVMGLKDQLKDQSKDEEDVKAIARLFADLGDSYVDLIATGSNEAMLIVQSLLEVTSHPEFDISSMTYNFWHNLQAILTRRDSYMSYGSEASMEMEKNRRLQIFYGPFEMLVSLVCSKVEFPADYSGFSEEDLKDFKHARYALSDVLLDATEVIGGIAALKILFLKLVEAVRNCEQNSRWQPCEAVLFCMQAVAKSVPSQENELLPQVFSLIPKLPLQQQQLHQTVCTTIGAYSKWIDTSQLNILPPLVDVLTKGMGSSEETAAAAAVAFKYICEDCRRKFVGSLDGLFHIYHIALSGEGGYKVSADDSLHLIEALSVIIMELPPEHASKALELLCMPAINPLQAIVNQGAAALQQLPARQLTVHIDRLACIFRNVDLPEIVADAVHTFWPLLKAIFDSRAWDMRTMESLCRSCKYAVRTCGRCMVHTIAAMLEEIQALYQQHNQSCFLYLSSEVIKIFGSDPSCTDYLRSLIEKLFGHTVKLLGSIEDFTARPDIADDCFLLASRCIRYCPDLFVPSSIFPMLIHCSMIGITIQHREACKSILSFLSDVVDLANSPEGEKYISIINNVILPRGAILTRILIAALTGALPSSRLEDVSYVLLSLTRTYRVKIIEWAKESISLIPPAAVTEAECSSFLSALSKAASGSSISHLTSTLEELSDVCRRNRNVQDMVQGALRPLDWNFTTVA